MRYIPYIFALVLAGLGYWVGFERAERQYRLAHIQTQEELFEVSESLSRAQAQLERYRHEQSQHAEKIEKEVLADPDTRRPGISADGLRRLERRWGVQN